MIYISFIPWLLYSWVNIKYSKKDIKPLNYKLIIIVIIYLYFTKYNQSNILIPIFFVSGIFLLIDTYYNIPKSKERIKNHYSKFLYTVPFIPIVAYIIFNRINVIYLSMFCLSFLIDGFIYFYNKR